jgi:hypothetical protein
MGKIKTVAKSKATRLELFVDYGTKAKIRMVELQTWRYTWVSDYHLMGNGRVRDLPSGGYLSILQQPDTSDPASDQQNPSLQLKHHVVSWLSTMHYPDDLSTKANLCLWIEEHKQD